MIKNIFLICGLIVFCTASPVLAQWGGTAGRRNSPVSDSPCWTKAYLEATPEQLQSLGELQRSFYKDISSLRNQYLNQRYELQSLLDSSEPDTRVILEKQRRFSDLQKKIDEISLQYFLKARGFFTTDQLSRLPPGCGLGFNYGQGMGWGRRWGQGGFR